MKHCPLLYTIYRQPTTIFRSCRVFDFAIHLFAEQHKKKGILREAVEPEEMLSFVNVLLCSLPAQNYLKLLNRCIAVKLD